MFEVMRITLRGIFRDRVFQGIAVLSFLFLLIPLIAVLSMRQVTELALTLSLSLTSLMLLLLAVFLGATSIWKDIDRRYAYSALSLPLSRSQYLLGRFTGIVLFLALTVATLGIVSGGVIVYSSALYPQERPFVWELIILALGFELLKYILLTAVSLWLSTLSTSFFLPVFGTLSFYWVGSISQEVYDYLHSPASAAIDPLLRQIANVLYYLLPNFGAFDYKLYAIYAITPDVEGQLLAVMYFLVYTTILLSAAALLLGKRELQ